MLGWIMLMWLRSILVGSPSKSARGRGGLRSGERPTTRSPQVSGHPHWPSLEIVTRNHYIDLQPTTSRPMHALCIFFFNYTFRGQFTWFSKAPGLLYGYVLNRIVLHTKEVTSPASIRFEIGLKPHTNIRTETRFSKSWLCFPFEWFHSFSLYVVDNRN